MLDGLEQPLERLYGETGITNDPAHRQGIDRIVAGNRQDAGAVRHDDVLALTSNAKPRLLQCANGLLVVDARDLRHVSSDRDVDLTDVRVFEQVIHYR